MKWIKINEDDPSTLPPARIEVLVYSEEGYISVEERREGQGTIYAEATDSGYATHWMTLPDSPQD